MHCLYAYIDAARVAERSSHSILGQVVEVQLVDTEPTTGEPLLAPVTHLDTIVVKGLGVRTNNESLLDLYFTNRVASGGGEVKKVEVKGTEAYVTFVDPEGNTYVYVSVFCLCVYVCLFVSFLDIGTYLYTHYTCITIIANCSCT